MADREEAISNFQDLTSSSKEQATEYLSNSAWNFENAVTAYFADMEETSGSFTGAADEAPADEPEYTGPRTLDGRPAPQYSQPSSSKAPAKKHQRRGVAGVATLGSLNNDDDDDDDDDDEDESNGPRDLFAGGEKSGLAVQDPSKRSSDPKKLISDILAKARANSSVEPVTPNPPSRFFRGSGQTVGGDGTESRTIADPAGNPIPTSSSRDEGPAQERVLHLWNDGFSIDDGELRRFDDPHNAMDLQMIRQGRAPLHLMNVRFDQPVDVKLQQHKEDYHPLPKIYRPFGGEGHRLGSPVPGDGSTPSPPAAATTTAATPAASSTNAQSVTPSVDDSQPTLTLRIQMPDGTRLPARFNTTNTVEDVYQFVQRASPATATRPWVLATTFPNKDHTDKSLVLGEMPEFKKGGTAVVKWA